MELLDAIEEFERVPAARSNHNVDQRDFVECQVLYVQQQLRQLWQRKHGDTQKPPTIPFYWVFSQFLKLVEAYPDGLTEAVVMTELSTLLKQRQSGDDDHSKSRKRRVRDEEEMADLLEEYEQEALLAKVVGYENHQLKIEMDKVKGETAVMFLHQRFMSCVKFFHSVLEYESSSGTYPFHGGRMISFTNAKLLERKDVDMGRTSAGGRAKFTLLPTPFLIARLNEEIPLDRRLLADSVSLSQVGHLVVTEQNPAVIQQLMIKVKVLDISAIRPCQTPLHIHRQVILLGDIGGGVTTGVKTPHVMTGSHVMVLWDDQVALSCLFRVGDVLSLFHPFVHISEPHESEIVHIMNEYSSQQRCAYYLEYGTATVVFCQSLRFPDTANELEGSSTQRGLVTEQEQPFSRLDEIRGGWHNVSLYAHVRNIKVSHGIPLLAAYFYAYYDSKTNQLENTNTGAMQTPPALNHSIVSKYYLVVLLEVYIASSDRLLTIEVTGTNALTALRLHRGQSVSFNGLATVNTRTGPVRKFRERRRVVSPTPAAPVSQVAAFAFPTDAYTNSMSSGVVALCSDWESIFGKQSLFNDNSKMMLVNTTSGLMNTTLDRGLSSASPRNMSAHAIAMVEMTVVDVGWLIPSGADTFSLDTTCGRGHFTMFAHKVCGRCLEMQQNQLTASGPSKWKCAFCQEIFFGTEDTTQTFCDLAVVLEDGRALTAPLTVLCQGDTVDQLLEISADDYQQMRITERKEILGQIVGQTFRLVMSRCDPYSVVQPHSATTINLRMDLVQPVDTFAAAHKLLEAAKADN